MVLFELLSYSDDEIDLITSTLRRWSEETHVDIQSEQGRAALMRAIALVSSGVNSREAIVANLEALCGAADSRLDARCETADNNLADTPGAACRNPGMEECGRVETRKQPGRPQTRSHRMNDIA